MTIRTSQLPPPPSKWLPSTWFSDTITALGSDTPVRAALPFGLILLTTSMVGSGCILLGGPVLVGETLLEGDSSGRTGNGEPTLLDRVLALLPLSTPVQAILAKDARYIARDLVLLSQIGIPVILYFVPFVIARQAMSQSLASSQDLLFLSLGVVGTIVYMETSILGLSSVGLEGRAFWLTLSAPVATGTFIRAKFLSAFVPSLTLCGPMLLFSCLFFGASLRDALLGLAVLLVVCATLCGFGVGLSGLFPRFVYDNPAHRASLTALVWGFVGATAYVIIAGISLGGGWFFAGHWHEIAGTILGIGVGVFLIVSLVAGLLPLLGAKARLKGYAWEE